MENGHQCKIVEIYVDNGFFVLQGKLYVRGDSKIFRFQNGKSESLFLQRKNPRRIAWTVLYRRQHKKGISEVRTAFFFTPG
jgi:large subunit ribosomal protein L24e